MNRTKASSAIVVLAVAAALIATPLPANAVQSCTAYQEVCRDTRSNFSGSIANLKTVTSNSTSGATTYYEVRKGNPGSGTLVCSGQMGYNATKTCNLGASYTGQLTFGFWKGQNTLTTISLN